MQVERDTDKRDQLWNAIVDQLRGQLAAKEASGELEQTKLDEPLKNELMMATKSGMLSIWLDTDTGKGSWNAITDTLDTSEPWFMSGDGRVELSGENMDISAAVDKFIEKLNTK